MARVAMKRPRILWVEDDLNQVLQAYQSLQAKGVDLDHVDTIPAAVEAVSMRHAELDMVICDVMFPKTTVVVVPGENGPRRLLTSYGYDAGLVFAQWVKEEYPAIKLVGVSIANARLAEVRWFQREASGFFKKQDVDSTFGQRIVRILRGPGGPRNVKSFIVHGRDESTLVALRAYLQQTLKLPEPVVLRDRPGVGRTIAEKFEEESAGADLVFVLLTPDDEGGLAGPENVKMPRARQNVILELGYFWAAMTRRGGGLILLTRGHVEVPSDLAGVSHIDISSGIEAVSEEIRREVEHVLGWTSDAL